LVIAIQETNEKATKQKEQRKRGLIMTTLPIWTLLLTAALIALAMYFLGSLRGKAKGRRVSFDDGHYQGYYDGYADCLVRARATQQTEESEACNER
jgi:hypothetical protein